MSPLIMCKKCGDAVNDIQVHECLPDMQVGVSESAITTPEPYPVSKPIIKQEGKNVTEMLAGIRNKFDARKNIQRPMQDQCICLHSKYHHDFDDDLEIFIRCLKCSCGKYTKGGEL